MDTKQRVQNFWKYFMNVRSEIEMALANHDEDALKELQREINLQVESVCEAKAELEFHDGFYELSFHGGANKGKQYICALLKKDAPKALVDDWIINSFRQPLSDIALHTVVDIAGKQYTGADFMVYYTVDEEAKCIHVQIHSEALKQLPQEQKQTVALSLLELFIGEVELEARIGTIEVVDEPIQDASDFCLLPNFYEDISDIVVDQQWVEYQEPSNIYTVYKLDQEIGSQSLRKDMKLIMTTNPQLHEELFNHELDSCNEAMRFGSSYGYLYYEIQHEKEDIALVRQQLEKELQDLFYPMSIARSIGGAIGTQYGYVDFIIFAKDAFDIILERLNEHLPFPVYFQSFH